MLLNVKSFINQIFARIQHRRLGDQMAIPPRNTTGSRDVRMSKGDFGRKKVLERRDGEEVRISDLRVGDAVIDELEEIKIRNVEGLFLTDRWKEEIFNYLKLTMEKKELGLLGDDNQLITQINEQRYEYLKPKTAQERLHLKFWHPPGRHDDQLFALVLACYASKEDEPWGVLARAW